MELPEIGQQCSNKECHRLNFLPYTCRICNLPFCDEHIKNHGCASTSEQNEIKDLSVFLKKKKEQNITKCEEEGCQDTRLHMLIKCEACHGHYCVTHRHINCPKVACAAPITDPVFAVAEMFKYAKETVDQQVNLNIEKARRKSKNAGMANKVQLMRLKSKANGLPSIPTQERIYFLIKIGREKNEKQEFPVFVSSEWSVGRSIDQIASSCNMNNQNNLSNAPKLRLFRDYDEQILTENLSEKINDLIKRGAVSNGETLFMDYV